MSNPAAVSPQEADQAYIKSLVRRADYWYEAAFVYARHRNEAQDEVERLTAFINRPLWKHAVERFIALFG